MAKHQTVGRRAREETRKRQLTLADDEEIDCGDGFENGPAPGGGDRATAHDGDIQNASRQLGNALEFILEQADTADPNRIGAIFQQLRDQFIVGPPVQRCFKDLDLYVWMVALCAAGDVHEPDGRDVDLWRDPTTHPASLIVSLDQQDSTALRQSLEHVVWWLSR